MHVTIWRHGQAGMAASDRLRELTAQGRDDVGLGCHQFHQHCESRGIEHPALILFSEWGRTTQTAEIIANAFNHARLQRCPALIPGRSVEDVDAELEALLEANKEAHVILVSHQPLVSMLVDYYLAAPGSVPPLVPGGQATLELEIAGRGCGSLCFSAQPPGYEAWQ